MYIVKHFLATDQPRSLVSVVFACQNMVLLGRQSGRPPKVMKLITVMRCQRSHLSLSRLLVNMLHQRLRHGCRVSRPHNSLNSSSKSIVPLAILHLMGELATEAMSSGPSATVPVASSIAMSSDHVSQKGAGACVPSVATVQSIGATGATSAYNLVGIQGVQFSVSIVSAFALWCCGGRIGTMKKIEIGRAQHACEFSTMAFAGVLTDSLKTVSSHAMVGRFDAVCW